MVIAFELLDATATPVNQLSAPMQADIPVRLVLRCTDTHDDKRHVGHVVNELIANLGDFLFAAHHLPQVRRQIFSTSRR